MEYSISEQEYIQRQRQMFSIMSKKNIEGGILFNATDIVYLTGFNFRPSERPVVYLLDPKGESHLFVPLLEKDHAKEYAIVNHIHCYREYPGLIHPMELLKRILVEFGFENKTIGSDGNGYSSPKGYEGPVLEEVVKFRKLKSIKGIVEKMRMIKSPKEIELIKISCAWGNYAHKLLHSYSKAGLSEIEISIRATQESTSKMVKELGSNFKPFGEPISAFYRGQIGPHSYYPHSQPQNITLKKGDNLISQAESSVWGYRSELERTMFVKEVSKEQEKYFKLMKEAQDITFESIIPGKTFASVEKKVLEFYKENNLEHLTRHHIGHNIGLINHEAPFFDVGDNRIMEVGMVATIEPGLYVENLGGFRHSDTILITEKGAEYLTYYPRDLNSLIVE